MTSLRMPPTFMPGMPRVQPAITPFKLKEIGSPRRRLESKILPSVSQPV